MNNETISFNGLDDSPLKTSLGQLVTHIYNLEEKVEHYKNEIEEHEAHSDQLEKDVETLLAENEKLKKENEEYGKVFLEYAGGDIGGESDLNPERFANYLQSRMKWDDEDQNDLQGRVDELEQENEKLNETLEDTLASLNFFKEQCIELKDERKELKVENELNMDLVRVAGEAVEKLEAENEKLKLMDPKLMEMAQTFDKIIQNQSKTSS